jgi:pyridoxamine 5'-phosphate oxidase
MTNVSKIIHHLRKDYVVAQLTEDSIKSNPVALFEEWLHTAITQEVQEPHAMNIATVADNGQPSSRIVFLRSFNDEGFIFYTNYNSKKGQTLSHNQLIAANLFWPELEKQVRIEGSVTKISTAQSDLYFASRPRESQLGAWASNQSEIIVSRAALEECFKHYETLYANQPIPRPPHWGGYCIKPNYFEFWQGGANRLHDRIAYTISANNQWLISRLCP